MSPIRLPLAVSTLALLAACAPTTAEGPATASAIPLVTPSPTASVPAAGETVAVATTAADAADDPAIWGRADAKPFAFAGKQVEGVLLGTDKKAGLYVYGLDGAQLQFLPEGLLNNVDLRPAGDGFIAAASDRGRMGVALYRFAGQGQLVPAGFLKSDVAEPYGFCMGMLDGQLLAVLVAKDGQVREYALTDSGTEITGTERRRYAVGTQSEGCAVDDKSGTLYIGEEDIGLWRYPLRAAPGTRTLVAPVNDGRLVADVEGVTTLEDGGETYLIVSSQGDSAFAVWNVSGAPGAEAYLGRFHVVEANGVDGVSGTDGVTAWSGRIGRFGNGLLSMQDDDNLGATQNFKLVDWQAVKAALAK